MFSGKNVFIIKSAYIGKRFAVVRQDVFCGLASSMFALCRRLILTARTIAMCMESGGECEMVRIYRFFVLRLLVFSAVERQQSVRNGLDF